VIVVDDRFIVITQFSDVEHHEEKSFLLFYICMLYILTHIIIWPWERWYKKQITRLK